MPSVALGPRLIDDASIEDAFDPATPAAWKLADDGFDPLRESSRQSRYATSNGFMGIRAARTISRVGGATPFTCVAGLFDVPGPEQPTPASDTRARLASTQHYGHRTSLDTGSAAHRRSPAAARPVPGHLAHRLPHVVHGPWQLWEPVRWAS